MDSIYQARCLVYCLPGGTIKRSQEGVSTKVRMLTVFMGRGRAVTWRGHGGLWGAGDVLAMVCTFVFHPNSYVRNEQGDAIRGWGLWEVIRFLRWSL